jgi:hypothetical protein
MSYSRFEMSRNTLWRIGLIFTLTLFTEATHGIFDLTAEGHYFSGHRTSQTTSSTGSPFKGYLIKPALHLNHSFSDVTFGIGPTVSFASVTYEYSSSRTLSDSATAIRSKFLQPFVRFELGLDSITETVRAYPIALDGPNAGMVLTSQIAEVKFGYRSLYFVTGGGIQAEILPHLAAFFFCGYTAADVATAEVKSFTVNGAPVTSVTGSVAFGYQAVQVGAGTMLYL